MKNHRQLSLPQLQASSAEWHGAASDQALSRSQSQPHGSVVPPFSTVSTKNPGEVVPIDLQVVIVEPGQDVRLPPSPALSPLSPLASQPCQVQLDACHSKPMDLSNQVLSIEVVKQESASVDQLQRSTDESKGSGPSTDGHDSEVERQECDGLKQMEKEFGDAADECKHDEQPTFATTSQKAKCEEWIVKQPFLPSSLISTITAAAATDVSHCLTKKFELNFRFSIASTPPLTAFEPHNAGTSDNQSVNIAAQMLDSDSNPSEAIGTTSSSMQRTASVLPGKKADDELLANLAKRWSASDDDDAGVTHLSKGRASMEGKEEAKVSLVEVEEKRASLIDEKPGMHLRNRERGLCAALKQKLASPECVPVVVGVESYEQGWLYQRPAEQASVEVNVPLAGGSDLNAPPAASLAVETSATESKNIGERSLREYSQRESARTPVSEAEPRAAVEGWNEPQAGSISDDATPETHHNVTEERGVQATVVDVHEPSPLSSESEASEGDRTVIDMETESSDEQDKTGSEPAPIQELDVSRPTNESKPEVHATTDSALAAVEHDKESDIDERVTETEQDQQSKIDKIVDETEQDKQVKIDEIMPEECKMQKDDNEGDSEETPSQSSPPKHLDRVLGMKRKAENVISQKVRRPFRPPTRVMKPPVVSQPVIATSTDEVEEPVLTAVSRRVVTPRLAKSFKSPTFISSSSPAAMQSDVHALEKRVQLCKQAVRIQDGLEDDDKLEHLVTVWRDAGRQTAEQLLAKMPLMEDEGAMDIPKMLLRLGVEPEVMGWDDGLQDWN